MGNLNAIGNTAAVPSIFGEALTMSSREIADRCEKRHAHVLRDIEKMIQDIGEPKFGLADLEAEYHDAQGKPRKEYLLPEDLVLTLISGYDAALRYRIVKDLEKMRRERRGGIAHLPQNFEQALEGLLVKVRENNALMIESAEKDATISAMKPAVDAYEAYLSEEGVCRIMDFCNKHGVKKNHPGYVLRDRGLMHQKKVLATQIGLKSGILKNVLEKNGFEYIDSKGRSVEAQLGMIVRQREVSLLKMIINAYGMTAFRNSVAFDRAKSLIGGAA